MPVEIYWIPGSPYAWRALLALEVKKVPYDSRMLSPAQGEHRSADYLKLNPRGKVPTLKDGDFVVCESMAILQYLDWRNPEPPLFGYSPVDAAQIMQSICETGAYIEPAATDLLMALLFDANASGPEQLQRSARTLAAELDRVDRQLEGRTWLVNGHCSAADIALFPFVQVLRRLLRQPEAAELNAVLFAQPDRYPAIGRWMGAVEQLPGYARTVPPHWR